MENNALTTAKDLLTIAKPLVDPLIAALLAPKIKKLTDSLNKKDISEKVSNESIELAFQSYLIGAYQKFCTMNVLVFPNQQLIIKDIYQPLTLVSQKDNKSYKINVFRLEYIQPYERILISDTAGMGKSTLMKWIGASMIEQRASIPLLIELKRITDKHKVINEVCAQLGDIFGDFDKDILLHLIKQGEFMFLLDGFDEVRHEFREYVIEDIKSFVQKTSNNWYVLTSRPDSALTAFGDFQLFNIKPLKPEESYDLIMKYDSVNKNKVGIRLIEDIQDKFSQVSEFLINPFLVSLLYKTYTYNKDIPSKKTTFYEEVYGALYKHHDLSKDGFKRNKKSGLDFQDFRTVINQLAFDTAKVGEVEYSEQELIKVLDNVKGKCAGISFKSTDFAEDIELNVPLFSREGNVLKWAHKSLQDFFAASYISSSSNKEKIIQALYSSKKSGYLNIIDFLYEMEYRLFRDVILSEIASSFIKYCDSSYRSIKGIKAHAIRRRQEVSFDRSHVLFYASNGKAIYKYNTARAEDSPLNKYSSLSYNSMVYSYALPKGPVSIHLVNSSFRHEIIDILARKGSSIVKHIDHEQDSLENFVTSLPMDEPLWLDDEKNNLLNESEHFEKFTQFLLDDITNSIDGPIVLDYQECVKLIDTINKNKLFDSIENELEGL